MVANDQIVEVSMPLSQDIAERKFPQFTFFAHPLIGVLYIPFTSLYHVLISESTNDNSLLQLHDK